MKQILSLLTCILFLGNAQATILRVNSTPGLTGVYTTAQGAHNAANNGDTIHLEPGVLNDYGSMNIIKDDITVLSTGYFLDSNYHFQHSLLNPKLYNVTINSDANNTKIIGVDVKHDVDAYSSNVLISSVHCEKIRVARNNSGFVDSNIIVEKCFVELEMYILNGAKNFAIRNNKLETIFYYAGPTSVPFNEFQFNIVDKIVFNGFLSNCIVSNNIIRTYFLVTGNQSGFSNCVMTFNISASNDLFPLVNGNLNNVDMTTVFPPYNALLTKDDNCHLLANYPNQNLGIFAGSNPYKLSGQAPIPAIYKLAGPSIDSGNYFNFTISTRSN